VDGEITTERLLLRPFVPAAILALIDGAPSFESAFGVPIAAGIRDLYNSGELSPAWVDRLRASRELDIWFHGFALIDRNAAEVIGTAGFKGAPDAEGVVEIAYGIAPGYQNLGYATEAAAALSQYAFEYGPARRVRAHTLPESNASARVLTKCGFSCVGEVIDPEDGLVWRWELPARRESHPAS
jgi:ribosomal-protein-alanine N-acetyltransferase